MTTLRNYRVGVFTHEGKRKPSISAYTMWFSESWDGCCLHSVNAFSGKEAKRLAIDDHRANCLREARP